MIEQALKFLTDLKAQADAPKPIDVGDARKKVYMAGGACHDYDTDPTPRKHAVNCLGDLIELAARFGTTQPVDGTPDQTYAPVVWFDESAVVLVIDDEGHRLETATLTLAESDVFKTLRALRDDPTGAWKAQKAFIRLLRIDLAGTLDAVQLLNKVRAIEFDNGQTITANRQSQKESLGRTITSEARSKEGDFPEQVTLRAPVYKTAGERNPLAVRCSVEVDPEEGKFRLMPLPDEIEFVRQFAMASIRERLTDSLGDIPAYYGKP